MPEIDLVPIPYYDPMWGYNWVYDNIPISNIVIREELMNDAIEINSQILRDAVGTQGTLSNRLNQSINQDGTLSANAINLALHNIGYHTDGTGPDSLSYVRMLADERAKLELIADDATNMSIEVQTPSTIVVFEQGPVILAPSESVTWNVVAPNQIQAQLGFPIDAAHRHYYDLVPVPQNAITPDYVNYNVTSVATPYMDGTLRVFINGIRLSSDAEVYVPGYLPTLPWTLMTFTPIPALGAFALSRAITPYDIMVVDFDIELA